VQQAWIPGRSGGGVCFSPHRKVPSLARERIPGWYHHTAPRSRPAFMRGSPRRPCSIPSPR